MDDAEFARAMPFRQQVIVAVPDVNESRRLSSWLEAEGYETVQRSTAKAASNEITSQPFDLLVADSAFVITGGVRGYGLARFRETPVIILGDAAGGRACAPMGPQIMFLERPVDRATFICTVTMALMDRRAERRSPRRSVAKPVQVTVNGVPSQLLDVSKEGVRLELPRERLVTPRFVLRVPVIGVGVAVQRVWVRMPRNDERLDLMWCGGQLSQNSSTAEQGWYGFVENLTSESASAPGR
jgi:hypothetical protein